LVETELVFFVLTSKQDMSYDTLREAIAHKVIEIKLEDFNLK